jgi:hypothetical protein
MLRLHKFTVLLLLAALPLQAFAMATMVPSIGGHGGSAHTTWLAGLHAHADDGRDAQAAPHPHHGGPGHQHHDGTLADGNTDSTECGVCADCCCPVAMPGAAVLAVNLFTDNGDVIAVVTYRIPARAPDRLDRPPRSTLV